MANKLKRILALMMALSLLAGQVAVPAAATETTEPQATIEITVSQKAAGSAEKTTTTTWSDTEGSTVTSGSETTTTVTNPSNGSTTNTTTTSETVTDTSTGSSTNTQSANTQTVTTSGNTTNKENSWSSSTTESTTNLQPGNPSVQTDTDKVITVTGSEESTETVTSDGNTQITTGSLRGQETTDIVDTTTTITTETEKYLYDDIDDDIPPVTETLPGEDITVGEWEDGTPSNNDWVDGKMEPGTGADLGTATPVPGQTTDATPEAPGADLILTPNGTWVENKIFITLEDVSNGKYPEPQSNEDYTVVELKDGDKLIGWEVTRKTRETTAADPFHTEDLTPGADWEQSGDVQTTVVRPDNYQVDTEGTTVGNVTTKVEEILDEEGNFLGYKVTKITVDNFDNADNPVESTSERQTQVIPGTETPTGFQLPDRPAEGTTTNSYGDVTTVTVTDLMEDGKHVGFTVSTVTVDKQGTLLYTETKNLYGTSSTVRTDVEIDPTTELTTTYTTVTKTEVEEIYVTENTRTMELIQKRLEQYDTTLVTEKDTYQLVNGKDGNLYFLYKGVMYAVTGTNTIRNSYDVASGTRVPMTGYTDADDLRTYNDQVKKENGGTTIIKDYYTGQTFNKKDTNENGSWRHVGYGLFSDFTLQDSKGKAHSAKQFKIQDGNQIRYVYCVELGAGIEEGTYYSPSSYEPGSDDVPPWTSGSGTATGTVQQLRSVALNGFWGTENGLGSLDAVKELMRRNNLSEEADRMTTGMALAATQAAIWEFAALNPNGSGKPPKFEGNFLTFDDERGKAPDADTADAIIALRDLLVTLANDAGTNGSGAAQAITAEAITGSVIQVKDQVTDSNGNAQTDEKGNNLYNTNLSFTMEVSTSSINGDLVLEVSDANGRTIGKYRLAGDPGISIYDAFTTRIRPDENGTYTLENLQLAENVAINLNLKGIQHLDDGVYIYKGEGNMQDFIGLSQKENHVDLNICMEFTVEEPSVAHTPTTITQHRTDSKTDTKTDFRTDNKTSTRTVTSGTKVTETVCETKVYGTVTTTKIEKDTSKESRNWEAYWSRLVTLSHKGEEGGDPTGYDETVALADAPKTGDLSNLWSTISVLSLSSMFLLKKKEDQE